MAITKTSRRLILIGTLLVAAIVGIAGSLIWSQRAAELAESQEATANFARVLAEQTSNSLQPIDLALREMLDRVMPAEASIAGPIASPLASRGTHDLLVEKFKGLPQIDSLMVIGADGRMVSSSRSFPPPPLDLSGRDYYQYLRFHDDHQVFVSTPARGYFSGIWTVYLARRINGPHGEFSGIVGASVTLSYLEDFYRAVTPKNQAVTLLTRDGVVLVHFPVVETMIGGKIPLQAPWYGIRDNGGGSYWSPGYGTNVARFVSLHPARDFPLIIDASTTEAAALAHWHQQTRLTLTVALFASVGVILLLRLFSTQFGRLERSEASLARHNTLLETSRLQFNAVLDNMSQGLTLFDGDRNLLVCNRRYTAMYGLSSDEAGSGTSFAQIIDHRLARGTGQVLAAADYLARVKDLVAAGTSFELINELWDGRTIMVHSQPLPGGGWVSTHEDITVRRQAEASMAFMARHDALTELPNRTLFQERLAEGVAMTRLGNHCALLCLDLDRFKIINDTLGHPVGDGLLRAVAGRLSAAVRDVDTVARLGGDEFAIVQVGIESPEHAANLADRIIKAIGQPYDIDGHRIVVGVSIGVSVAPRDGIVYETLLRNADTALYLAKTRGRGTCRFFEPEMDTRIHELRLVELDLRDALLEDSFELRYQPVLDLRSGVLTGFEALIRWNHPARGVISPADFIPIAEETGLIVPIGEWVLREACVEAARWPDDIEIAVNLSPAQFNGGLANVVRDALAASGLAPHRLELEITETLLLRDSEDTLIVLHQLRASGIRIALDDFGTGYSSLNYLRGFPFDKIKIDRSFIHDIDTNKDSTVIVGAMIGLARSLGMSVVAEGVETPAQLAELRHQGCDKIQGYLISGPVPAVEVPALISVLCAEAPRSFGPRVMAE
jgi:diguanylate cyclase (GGDEF)-like protein